ncbi:hypothetical protein SDC9_189419 [bioreactor metagenome]|uniref:Uncharacterized protein n=1 Tax=bioreactor metagenome TaxID=1076179 RepID=A0A645I0B3_9ZZZZ
METSSYILLIASANIGATDNTSNLLLTFSSGNPIVLSTTNFFITLFSILSKAGPDKTPCEQQA